MSDDNGLALNIRRTEDPDDRLSGLAAHMAQPLEVEPDVRAVVLLHTDHPNLAVSLTVGYDEAYGEDAQGRLVLMLLRNAEAILRSHGRTLHEALDQLYNMEAT